MPEPIQTITKNDTVLNANEILAQQITQALRANELIDVSDEAAVLTLLTSGNVKAGDWLRLLENNLLPIPTPTDPIYAPTHHST